MKVFESQQSALKDYHEAVPFSKLSINNVTGI